MALKAIIFDIDGVLADSRLAVVENTKRTLADFGESVDSARVEKMSSAHSAESVLVSLVPKLQEDRALLKKMLLRLSEHTRNNMELVRPTALVAEVPLLSKKYKLAAATNRKSSAHMVLEHLGIAEYFSAVVTSADAPHKPDPTMIRMAIERLKLRADEAVFVGDNEEDRQAGVGAGVKFVKLAGENKNECREFLKSV